MESEPSSLAEHNVCAEGFRLLAISLNVSSTGVWPPSPSPFPPREAWRQP
ncbi:hypothetical protein [Synechococcus sp. PCC 7336]|nr:hypothetical protein [Synechococcus sp. PCC 7336]